MTKTIPTFGFGMQGLGESVADIVHAVCERFDEVTYLEIGVGHGVTLSAVASLMRGDATLWRAIGIDLPHGYSLDQKRVEQSMKTRGLPFGYGSETLRPSWEKVTLYLADSQRFLPLWQDQINLALIDGCHGKPCAMNDFLNIEKWIAPRGIVLFHDFGPDQQWQPQPHCKDGIDVAGACRELGLLDNDRPGWRFLETLIGEKEAGAGDMGVFERL